MKRLRAWFTRQADLIWQRNQWRQRAIINQEHMEYWQDTANFYRKKWNEALSLLPEAVREELLKSPILPIE